MGFDRYIDSVGRVIRGTWHGLLFTIRFVGGTLLWVWGIVTMGMLAFVAVGLLGFLFTDDAGREAFTQSFGNVLGIWFVFSMVTAVPGAVLYFPFEED